MLTVYCDRTDCYNNDEGECYSVDITIDEEGKCTEYTRRENENENDSDT